MNILVLGIGQSLRGDDAAGLEAIRLWQERYPSTAEKVMVDTTELPGLALLDSLLEADASLLVDAVRSVAPVGTVLRLDIKDLSSFKYEPAPSHNWGVAETLHLGLSLYPTLVKKRITLFGIVGSDFKFGAALSSEVQAGLAKVVGMVESEIQLLITN